MLANDFESTGISGTSADLQGRNLLAVYGTGGQDRLRRQGSERPHEHLVPHRHHGSLSRVFQLTGSRHELIRNKHLPIIVEPRSRLLPWRPLGR